MFRFHPFTLFTFGKLLLLLSALSTLFHKCSSEDTPPRILVFSKTAAFRHTSIPTGMAALRQICRENGMLMDTTENADDFTAKNLCRYAAVVFLSTTGDVLNPTQEAEFERYIQAGGGFVGIHAAADTEYGWSWYGGLVGAYFVNHPAIQDARLFVEDHDHPATRHLGASWQRHDEWYNFRDVNPQVHVLLKIDETSYQGGAMGANHPMSWCHEYDGGRAFYTALGHTEASYAEPEFRQHLLGGITYAIGKRPRLNYDLCRTPELPDPTRFVKTELIRDLYEPMELDLLPDGSILFIERRGAIKHFNPNTGLVSTAYKMHVHTEHEDGLLGLAIDPNWELNHWIYLYYSPDIDKPVNYLSRFVFVADTLDPASEKILLEVDVQREECCHAAGCIEFDADGYLYLSTGDNTNPFASKGYAPIDERRGRNPWDAQKSSANTMDLRGKILRIKPQPDGTYICPAGNLFTDLDVAVGPWPKPVAAVGGPEGGRPEIYVMGCRNPFRLSVDSRRRLLFWGEVGPDAGEPDSTRGPAGHDEVNRARRAGFFGWPYFVGNNKPYRDYSFTTRRSGPFFDPAHPVNDSPNNHGARHLPAAQPAFIWYPYGNSADFPLLGNGGRNAMAGPVYYCDRYPAATRLPDYYNGKLITYDWMRYWMMAVTIDSTGNFSRMEPFADSVRLSRPIDMVIDKNGSIWVLEYGLQWFSSNPDARLSRIDYVRGNRPPVARLRADKTAGAAPCTVVFSAAATVDYDGNALHYAFDFDDQSQVVELDKNHRSVAQSGLARRKKPKPDPVDSVAHTFVQPGTYTVTLRVTDSQGATATAIQKITVGNEPPLVRWDLGGKNRSFYTAGEKLKYRVLVSDQEDGTLAEGRIAPATVATSIDYLETGFDITLVAQGHQAALQHAEYARGKILLDRSDCKNCHAVDRQINGPAFQAIAERYRKNALAVRNLSRKVILGGAGVWGETLMSAHPQLKETDVAEMVQWILSLGAPPKPKTALPVQGDYVLAVPLQKTKKPAPLGTFLFNASYTDRGSATQAPISSGETLALRPAFQQAELADSLSKSIREYRPFQGDTVVLNEMKHGSFFVFKQTDLRGIYSVAIQLGSGDAFYPIEGGRIELRLDNPNGPLAGMVALPKINTPDKMTFSEVTLPIDQALWPSDGAFHDLYFVLKNENYPSKNVAVVDWVRFNL